MSTHAHDPLLDALRTAVRRDHARRHRRNLVAIVAVSALMLTGVAVGANQDWWTDAPPPPNEQAADMALAPTKYPDGRVVETADRTRARTVARASGVVLVAAPRANGSYCIVPQVPSKTGKLTSAGIGAPICLGVRADGLPRSVFGTLVAELDGEQRWLAFGRVTDREATGIDLGEAAGVPFRVALARGGFFLTELPRSLWQRLDERSNQVSVVGGAGVLRSTCVSFGLAPYSVVWSSNAHTYDRMDGEKACYREGRSALAPPVKTKVEAAAPIQGRDPFTGKQVSLASLAGKPVVVAFSAGLCLPPGCSNDDATLSFLADISRVRPNVATLGVSVRRNFSKSDIKNGGMANAQVAHDPDRNIADTYGVTTTPTWFFLDRDHHVRAKIVGVPSESDVAAALRMAASD